MTALPAAGYFSDPDRTNAEAKTAQDDMLAFVRQMVGGQAASTLEIDAGVATPNRGMHAIDTEAAAASDDLTNLDATNLPDGSWLLIGCANAARVVTVKHNAGGAGQIALFGAADAVLDATSKFILLRRSGADWAEIGRFGFVLPIAQGGTGATDAAAARAALGIVSGAAALGAGRNFAGRTNATNSNYQVDFTADELVVKDASGNALLLTSVSVTADITVSGAGGRDTGSEASNTWYYLWVIWNGTTTAALLSTSATSPTMPSGYTYKALVGAVRNDNSSNFIAYRQTGLRVYYATKQQALMAGSATSETSVSLSSVVPTIAQSVQLYMYLSVAAGGSSGQSFGYLRIVTGSNFHEMFGFQQAGIASSYDSASIEVPNLSQAVLYITGDTSGSGAQTLSIDVQGFTLPGGGS